MTDSPIIPLINPSQIERDWYFTFGCAHFHANEYVVVHGTFEEARDQMIEWFGTHWSMQYGSAEEAGIDKWKLTELKRK